MSARRSLPFRCDFSGFAERRDVERRVEKNRLRRSIPREDLARAVVAVHVGAAWQRSFRSAINVASGDRTATVRMRVVENRKNVILRAPAKRGIVVRACEALEHTPA